MSPSPQAVGPHFRLLVLLVASLFALVFFFSLFSADTAFEAGDADTDAAEPPLRPRPPRFPDVPEAFIPTLWDDTVPLIYTTAPGVKPGYVWLFGQGVLVNKSDPQPVQCLLGEVARPVVRSKRFWYTKFTTAFLCELPTPPARQLEAGALLTIVHRGAPVASTARFRPEFFVDSVKSDDAGVGPLRYGTCMVTQMRDMAYMVDEWVDYHRHIGVDHFYIYDNNSTDNLAARYGRGHDHIEVIPWPWRRSQNQAYSHALAFARSRCHWTFFADVDYFLMPLTSPPTVQGIVAHVLRQHNCSTSSVVELRFEGLRPSHDNRTTCPDAPVIETYVHRRTDKNAYDLGFGLVMSSAADALHHIHFAELQSHHKSVKVAHEVAFGYHFTDRCWPQYYRQKCFGRSGIRDWDIPDDVDETHPTQSWWNIGKQPVVTDTRLRDFTRTLVSPAPSPVIRRAPFEYSCS